LAQRWVSGDKGLRVVMWPLADVDPERPKEDAMRSKTESPTLLVVLGGIGTSLVLLCCLYFVLLGCSALTLLTALGLSVVHSLRNWRAVAALIGAGLLALPVYLLLHTYAARLSLRAVFPALSAASAHREDVCPPQRWALSRSPTCELLC